MARTTFNLLVDIVAAIALVVMVATGYVLRVPLPASTHKTHTLWGLTRNQWGDLHFWASAALVAVLLVHLFLHWRWVVATIGHRLGADPSTRSPVKIGMGVLAAAVVILLGFGWATHRGVQPIPIPEDQSIQKTAETVDFWREVYPVFEKSCLSCHGPRRAAGGFRVDRREFVIGSDAGNGWVVPGEPARSPLIGVIAGARPGLPHPERHRLPDAEVELIRWWIAAGAPWPDRGE